GGGTGGRNSMVRCVPLSMRGPTSGVSRVKQGAGRARRAARLLATLLDVGADEVLGVLLQDVVDLVEDRVDILAELLATLLPRRRGVARLVVVAATAALALGLLLRHDASCRCRAAQP